jgi:hypothetical protein
MMRTDEHTESSTLRYRWNFLDELLKTYITDMEQDETQWEQIIRILRHGQRF